MAKSYDSPSAYLLIHIRPSAHRSPPSPNDQDQPGRLEGLQATESQNAGPVNCIRLFGLLFRMSPLTSPLFFIEIQHSVAD
jgi:hypothetical protein